ncbi:pilus assembly protein TadG-related protein [bacterium]|nr:pilus assembly protein TadG-related protein [bacterium]
MNVAPMSPAIRIASFRERGFAVVFAMLALFVVIAFSGMALDFGRLQRRQTDLQHAVDAAALAASAMVFEAGITRSELERTTEALVRDNLRMRGVSPASSSLAIGLQPHSLLDTEPVRQISVRATSALDPLVMDIAPFITQDFTVVAASAVAESRRIFTCLAIDTSGSMCENDGPVGSIANNNCEEVRDLKAGVISYVQLMRPEDYLGMWRFSQGPGNDLDSNCSFDRADDCENDGRHIAVEALVMVPMTRVGRDGLVQILQRPPYQNVLDSHPYTPTNGYSGLQGCRLQITGNPNYNGAVDYGAIIYFSDGVPWTAGESDLTAFSPGCSVELDNYPTSLTAAQRSNYDDIARKVHMGRWINTINQADLARNSGLTVYAIALGDPNAKYPRLDAFQGLPGTSSSETLVKDILMARIANDQVFLQKEFQEDTNDPNSLRYSGAANFPCVPDRDSIRGPEGKMVQTADSGDLRQILRDIGLSIKAKLVR